MIKKLLIIFILVFLFAFNVFSSNYPELKDILDSTQKYCEKLKNASLKFYCNEEIIELIYIPPIKRRVTKDVETIKNTYLYDYQLLKTKGFKYERRIILKENGKKVKKREAGLSTWSKHSFVVMGPYGIFGKEWQSKFIYKIIKRKKIKGERIVIIEAVPKAKSNLGHMWGKAWIRESDYTILKIEWDQSSVKGLENIETGKIGVMAVPKYKLISEYGIKHDGIMFPVKYSMLEQYYLRTKGYKIIKSIIKVKYSNYKFFTVKVKDTKVKYYKKI